MRGDMGVNTVWGVATCASREERDGRRQEAVQFDFGAEIRPNFPTDLSSGKFIGA